MIDRLLAEVAWLLVDPRAVTWGVALLVAGAVLLLVALVGMFWPASGSGAHRVDNAETTLMPAITDGGE